mmetsp:Transcript_23477/g.69756  ORF Transcript_23477/g.69756 Transcript_23477/m.69756 type:complete len:108 (+) Transcript_23477:421-744(+)
MVMSTVPDAMVGAEEDPKIENVAGVPMTGGSGLSVTSETETGPSRPSQGFQVMAEETPDSAAETASASSSAADSAPPRSATALQRVISGGRNTQGAIQPRPRGACVT